MRDWHDVSTFALTLPDTVAEPYYGGPAVKVASNRRAFVTAGHEAGSFVLMIDPDTKDLLLETDPGTFWQTPHYEGWPSLLVRHAAADDSNRVRAIIERARDQAVARKPAKPRKKA